VIVPEYEAKALLRRYGLRIPTGRVAVSPEEAQVIARDLGCPVVVKALIPAGGRGKAGGVKQCTRPEDAFQIASALLGQPLLGHIVQKVLVEQAMRIDKELYASVVANIHTGQIDLILSFTGGIDIEQRARQDNSDILHLAIEPGSLLPVHRLRAWLRQVPVAGMDIETLAHTLSSLYYAAADLDAMLLEINPLAFTEEGELVLLDCKLEVDDNGLARQPALASLYAASLGDRERRARALGVSYVPLDGDIGVITSGAGLGMATLDLLKHSGYSAANFLDTGGGISETMVKGALELIMEPAEVRGAIVNLYGGINRMVEAAKGILAALENIPRERPIVVKILGNQQEEAWAMLERASQVHVIRVVQTEAAVEKLAELVG
jgi:succinyl-CoA synthetase beta subunit